MQWCCILSGEDFLLDFFKTNPVVTNASDNLLFLSFEQVMHFRPKNIHFYSKITITVKFNHFNGKVESGRSWPKKRGGSSVHFEMKLDDPNDSKLPAGSVQEVKTGWSKRLKLDGLGKWTALKPKCQNSNEIPRGKIRMENLNL